MDSLAEIVVRKQCLKVAYLGRLVFGCGEEVGAVTGELDIVDLVVELVGLDGLELFTGLDEIVRMRLGGSNSKPKILHTFGSYWLTLPSSCPAMIYFDRKLHPATVALLSSQVMRRLGSSACCSRLPNWPSP